MRTCKECGKRVWKGKSYHSFCRWVLRLCRYCYGWKFPERERRLPPLRGGSGRLLSWGERREQEQNQFEGTEQLLWDKAFLKEWKQYLKARKRGEV